MRRLTWILFALLLLMIVILISGMIFGYNLLNNFYFLALLLILPILLLLSHASLMLGIKRGSGFILFSMLMGWLMETVGLMGGTFFGGRYIYNLSFGKIGMVPVEVVFYWAVFIYTGYWLTNNILYFFNIKPPVKKKDSVFSLLGFAILDGYVVTAIDLFMDPIQVQLGRWSWLDGGKYFGVPWGNFVGWWVITTFVTLLIRSFEYYSPAKVRRHDNLVWLPLLGYGMLLITFVVVATGMQISGLSFVGCGLMLPPTILAWLGYKKLNSHHLKKTI